MNRTLFNHFENAFRSLKSHRNHTLFTITGVTIGIASIVCILSLGGGVTNLLTSQTADAKDNIAIIQSTSPNMQSSVLFDYRTAHHTNNLTKTDVHELQQTINGTVVPLASLHVSMASRDSTIAANDATLVGTNPHLAELANLAIRDGEFLNGENGSGIVIGNQLAIDLFGTEHAIGNIVTIRDKNFTVIGTLRPVEQPLTYLQIDFNNAALIHLSTIEQLTQHSPQIQQIALVNNGNTRLSETIEQARTTLKTTHQGETDFEILTGTAIARSANELFRTISILVGSVAIISLLVGGIGIMNSMLVNVAERRREVGIRKAIGATNAHIINQFLIESCVIGLLGGILGCLLGIGVAYLISMYLPFAPLLQWHIGALGIGISLAVGIIFGLYPAINAARKDPIESLRN